MAPLENLMQQCTVKITVPGAWGTGFFVAPGLILTCAHVVRKAADLKVTVFYPARQQLLSAIVKAKADDGKTLDLALVELSEPLSEHPCVFLDEEPVAIGQALYSYGYLKSYTNAAPVRPVNEGLTGDTPPLLKLQGAQIEHGISGAALLNLKSGKVCGIVKETRATSFDLGGGAIPSHVILEQFPQLRELQQEFHEGDRQWKDLVAKLPNIADTSHSLDSSMPMTQTNFNSRNVDQAVKQILILSVNDEDAETSIRREQVKKIREALKRGKHKDKFNLENRPDIGMTDLSQELSEIEPYVIDIYGRKVGIEALVLEGSPENTTSRIPEKLIDKLFSLHNKGIECVLLNGCYLEEQAREVVRHIEFVIGISQSLEDTKILDFLNEFYYYLASDRTIKDSYDLGCLSLEQKGLDDTRLPILLNKQSEIKRRSLEEELSSCNKEIEKDQDNIKLWNKKASLLTDLDRSKEADEAYKKASSLDPSNYEIRTKQGNALKQFGEYEKAAFAYNEALKLDGDDYKVWWKNGQTLVELENHDEAVESYRTALKLKPHSPDSYIICREYACLLAKLGQHQESIALYKKSLGFEPNYRVSSYEKKQLYKKMYSREG